MTRMQGSAGPRRTAGRQVGSDDGRAGAPLHGSFSPALLSLGRLCQEITGSQLVLFVTFLFPKQQLVTKNNLNLHSVCWIRLARHLPALIWTCLRQVPQCLQLACCTIIIFIEKRFVLFGIRAPGRVIAPPYTDPGITAPCPDRATHTCRTSCGDV